MTSGEVYPNAPLALVAAEIRFPPVSERGLGMPVQKLIRDQLDSDWVIQNDTTQTFQAEVGPAGPKASLTHETTPRIHFTTTNEDNHDSARQSDNRGHRLPTLR